ncbi:MAG: CRISPR-associated helicase Cas3' [Thermoplasmatales archaeon]|nr:CRISPR-associated helicase Cas3' [Thermoplasmatales archaeon]
MKFRRFFKEITGYQPYDFQLECTETLASGKSLILTAPTGSGKSEVALVPFILSKNEELPSQMVYSLPTRTLIENLSHRALKYAAFKNQSVAIHHGKRVESSLFEEDIIVTTIDQTVGAYVCTPLSAPLRRGNIFAGGVSSAFLVFDEIHTFDPHRGLQTAITLIEHSSKLKLPVCVMSATLPSILVEKIENKIIKPNYNNVETKEVEDENEIKSRKDRKVTLHINFNKILSADIVVDSYNSLSNKKLIVICNTVDKAQALFKDLHKDYENKILRDEITDVKLILIHSRFLDDDRKEKEDKLQRLFYKESKENVILISTQVIEVGINISANAILTEIAPIDSLIQRAGRCVRWGGEGDFYVYNAENYGPYKELKDIIDNTKKELEKYNGETLTWALERKLVNEILTDYYTKILDDSNRYKILGTLARAVYGGNKSLSEETVREAYTCGVSICNDPRSLGDDIKKLQKVNVNVWVFKWKVGKLLENDIKVWKIGENNIIGDYETKYAPSLINDVSEILPFQNYIVSLKGAKYDNDTGLILSEKGTQEFSKIEERTIEEKIKEFYMKKETWVEHANRTLEILDAYFLPKYNYVIGKFADAFNMDKKDLIEKIRIAVALHDIGKLNIHWQKKIGWNGREPLAHSDRNDIIRIGIPHATVSAVALGRVFRGWGKATGVPFYLAVSHHHSPRAKEYKKYKFINNWNNIVVEVLPNSSLNKDVISYSKGNGEIEIPFIDISQNQNVLPYKFYAFTSKILRLSDWIATQGEINAILYS